MKSQPHLPLVGRSPCVAHLREAGRVGVASILIVVTSSIGPGAARTINAQFHLPLAGRSARVFARRVGDGVPMRRLLFQGIAHRALTEAPPKPDDDALKQLAARVDTAARRRLGRSLAIREVDAGSCNGCELEIHALNNAFYDLERFG